jgi:hypothetical protein
VFDRTGGFPENEGIAPGGDVEMGRENGWRLAWERKKDSYLGPPDRLIFVIMDQRCQEIRTSRKDDLCPNC